MGVQEDPQDSWTVVENNKKSKKKSDVLQVSKAVSSQKDAVFEATSKLKEKKGSLSCFDRSPRAQRCSFFRSFLRLLWTFFLVSTTRRSVTHSTRIRTMFLQCCLEDPLFAHQVQSLERLLRVRERVSAGQRGGSPSRCDPKRGQREGAVACSVSEPDFQLSVAGIKDLSTGNCDLDERMDVVRSVHGVCRGSGRAGTARATAGESGIEGLLEESESSWLVPTASGHEVKREFLGARRPREPDAEQRL